MAVTDQQKLDFLLKKIGYTKTKTGSVVGTGAISGTPKQPFAEAIPSPLIIANGALWNEADSIPTTPPGADTTQVKVYLAATSGLRMTADATSSGQRAYIAYSTYNDTSSTRLTNWIDTQFGASYIIKVYKGDPNSGGVNLSAAGSGANDGWFFDYSAGVLNFNDTNVPSGVTDTNIYIVGYRYIGQTGAPTSGISTFSFKDLTVERNLDVGVQGGISTFRNNIDANGIIEGIAGENKIPFLYSNLAALPNAGTYHGMFAHVHSEGRGYFAHAGNWLELVNKDTSGNVGLSGDLDVDGHTELDNVNITGVTSTAAINVGGILDVKSTFPQIRLTDTNHNDDFHILNEHGEFKIRDATNNVNRIIINSVGVTTFSSTTNFNQGVNVIGDLDVDGHTNLDNISVAGVSTFTGDATFSGNVSIGGTLTYEDVTNVDSVGLLTARSGIRVTGGVIEAQAGENKIPSLYANMAALPSPSTYHGMFAHVHSTGRGYFAHGGAWYELVNADLTGRVGTGTESYFIDRLVSTSTTATSLNVTGVTTAVTVDINGDLDVDGHTNLDNLSVGGATTITATNREIPFKVVAGRGGGGIGTYLFTNSVGRFDFNFENTYNGNWATGSTFHTRLLWTAPNEPHTTPEVCSILPYTAGAGASGALHALEFNVTDNTSGLKKAYWMSHNKHQFYLNGNQNCLEINSTLGVGVTSYIYHGYTGGASDTHTRFGFPTNDNIVFDTDGTERLRINNSSSTFTNNIIANGNIDLAGDIDVDGHTNLDNVSVAGFSTFAGITTVTGDTLFTKQFNVSGVSTFFDDVNIPVTNKKLIIGASGQLQLYNQGYHSRIDHVGNHWLTLRSNAIALQDASNNYYFDGRQASGSARLFFSNNPKLETTSSGINVTGTIDTDGLVVSGVTTAAGHVLPDADVTYDLGSSSKQWRNLYADNIVSAPGNGFIGPDLTVRNFKATGISTFGGNARFNSTIAVHDGTTGSNGQYLKSVGTGVTWASFPTLRTRDTIVASAGQTFFSFNYTVNFIDVFVNGIKLTDSEFTASNGTSVTLAVGCFVGDIVELVSYNTVSSGGGGGGGTLNNIVEDTSPQLGGNLDLFGKTINGTGGISFTGVVTATTFIGDGSGLTGITASGTGVVIKNNNNTVGTAGTINFGDDLSVTPIVAGIVTVGIDTSQINLNKLNVSGISTFNGNIDVNADLDVDGHTNLDNVSIAGVTTFGNNIFASGTSRFEIASMENALLDGSIEHTGDTDTKLQFGTDTIDLHTGGSTRVAITNTGVSIPQDLDVDGHTNLDNVSVAGVVTATTFVGAVQATSGTFSSNIDANGDLDVDGHTNLDNVSISGVSTATGGSVFGLIQAGVGALNATIQKTDNNELNLQYNKPGNLELCQGGGLVRVHNNFNVSGLSTMTGGAKLGQLMVGYGAYNITVQPRSGNNTLHFNYDNGTEVRIGEGQTRSDLIVKGDIKPKTDSAFDLGTTSVRWRAGYFDIVSAGSSIAVGTGVTIETNGQATYTGIVTAQKFVGDGSLLTGISGSGGVTVQDEGNALSTQASTLNFVGTGVVASGNGATKTITINAGAADTTDVRTNTLDVVGVSTFNSDVHFGFHGAGNPKIHFDESSDLLWFKAPSVGASSSKLWLGNGTSYNNLQLQTTSTAAVVSTSNTKLELQSASNHSILLSSGNGIDFLNNAGSTTYYMRCVENSGSDQTVELHYGQGASSKKFETSDKGVKVGTGVTIETNGQATYTGIVTAQKFVGDGSGLTNLPGGGSYGNNDVDNHLNVSGASSGQILSWNGSDYAWVADQTGGGSGISTISGVVNIVNDLDVDGHTNLDNVSIVGVTTATGNVNISGDLAINSTGPKISLNDTNNNPDYDILNTDGTFQVNDTTNGSVRFRIGSAGQVDVLQNLDVGSNIKLGNAGVVTATTFSGSGASLTSIPAGQLTGTVADARISTLTASKLSGALPAISGANLTGIAVTEAPVTDYTITSPTGSYYLFHGGGVDVTSQNPDLYLIRGQKYRFNNTTGSSHPFAFRNQANNAAYTDGVTGSQNGIQFFTVPYDAPSSLKYRCTIHTGSMLGTIYISGGPGRGTTSAATGSIAQAAYADITIPTPGKTFTLLKIAISAPAWVILYTDTSSRTSDAAGTGSGRSEGTDPTPGSGVLAEVSTTTSGASTFKMTPGVIGWNDDGTPTAQIYARVYNKRATSGSNAITVTLTSVSIEA